jgi:hypothetical protein
MTEILINNVGALAGLMAELTQHYVQPLEVLLRGVPVKQTMKEIASKIRSGRTGKIFFIFVEYIMLIIHFIKASTWFITISIFINLRQRIS